MRHAISRWEGGVLAADGAMYCIPMKVCNVMYCTSLHCTVLYCTVLYCTVLYCIPMKVYNAM